jgi:hypothetical protein
VARHWKRLTLESGLRSGVGGTKKTTGFSRGHLTVSRGHLFFPPFLRLKKRSRRLLKHVLDLL